MELSTLTTYQFRNLDDDEVRFDPHLNLVLGNNGQGKSNLIEAIVMLGNIRSSRGANPRAVVRHQRDAFRLQATVRYGEKQRHLMQIVEVGPPVKRQLYIDSEVVSMATYLQVFPVYALSSEDKSLVSGPPQTRRSFLDRLCFLLFPDHFTALRRYGRFLQHRNALLSRSQRDAEVVVFEEKLAQAAAEVITRRVGGFTQLTQRFVELYRDLGGPTFPAVDLEYRSESWLDVQTSVSGIAEQYRLRYHRSWERDHLTGFTGDGPHRHDLRIRVDGRTARDVLSGGQTKVVAATLRLAALAEVEGARGDRLLITVDDVDAELDDSVLMRVVGRLVENRQVIVTSARESVLPGDLSQVVKHVMNDGALVSVCRRAEES